VATAGALEVLGLIEGVACVLLAGVLIFRGGGRPGPIVLGLNFVAFAGILFFLTLPILTSPDIATLPPWAELGAYVCRVALWTSLLAFAVTYPHWKLSAAKVWGLVGAVAPGALILFAIVVNPTLFITPESGPTQMLKALALGLRDVTLVASLWLFARHWFQEEGAQRPQYLVVLLPYLLYGLNDGLSGVVAYFANPASQNPFLFTLSATAVVMSLGTGALAIGRIAQGRGRRAEEGLLVGWVAGALVLSLVQFFDGTLGKSALFLHFLVDGVATFALFWGVARHHILDIDLKVRFGIKNGVIGAVGVAILFIVQQTAEQFIGQEFGILLGAILAGAGVLLIKPLHRLAERVSDRAVPSVAAAGGADAYLSYRRLAIYRSAMEGLLRDGVKDLDRAHSLKALRKQLAITPAEHSMIEAEVRDEIQHGGPTPGAVPT
jgi:hypothetical protein